MAKLTTAEFIDAIKELSVLELNDLVKACEEEFGGIKSDFVDFFHTFVVLSTGIYTSKNGYVNMYMLDF